MARTKDTFQTKSIKTPPVHLKQPYSASLELNIIRTFLNPYKKINMAGKFQVVGAQLLVLPHHYSTKLQSQAAATL